MTTQLSLLDRDWCTINAPNVLTAMRGKEFSSDDLYAVVTEHDDPKLLGILVAKLVCQRSIKRIGSRKSERPEANGRWIGTYEVVE